ncbi:MAG: DUF4292 domain-containing protein [Candidatus Kapaibacterium sp.]
MTVQTITITMHWCNFTIGVFISVMGLLSGALTINCSAADVSLQDVLSPRRCITATGTVSLQGAMTISGVPFDATLNTDTLVVNTGSPFGMKTSSVYARTDTFVVLNYLTRQVIDGNPASDKVAGILPIPLGIDDIRSLVRGIPPGDLTAFELQTTRQDGQLLFRRRDSLHVEFALVDSTSKTIRQYQRKQIDGRTILNVTYGSYREVDGSMVPYGVNVTANDDEQKIQFRFDEVRLTAPNAPLRPLAIPSSFSRVTLN